MIKQEWVCGHFSTAMCAECYGALARRANKLAEQVFGLNDEIERLNRDLQTARAALELEPPSDAGNIFIRGWKAAMAAARASYVSK